MQFLPIILVAATSFTGVLGQATDTDPIPGLPECSKNAIYAAFLATGCVDSDYKCICESATFISSSIKAVQTNCTVNDVAISYDFATDLCGSVNVTITLPPIQNGSTTTPPPPVYTGGASLTTATSFGLIMGLFGSLVAFL